MLNPFFCLVPDKFYSEDKKRELLGEVVAIPPTHTVYGSRIDEYDAVALYSCEGTSEDAPVPDQVRMLRQVALDKSNYNKIFASLDAGRLYLIVAQGRSLLMCSNFEAEDFVTAQYFIFAALKRFQLNPQVSTIRFCSPLSEEEVSSLFNYFHDVQTKGI